MVADICFEWPSSGKDDFGGVGLRVSSGRGTVCYYVTIAGINKKNNETELRISIMFMMKFSPRGMITSSHPVDLHYPRVTGLECSRSMLLLQSHPSHLLSLHVLPH